MHSDIEFRHLGKINEATIKVRPFTVIAGCNSSGKSFITKSLYALFSGVGDTSVQPIVLSLLEKLDQDIQFIVFIFSGVSPVSSHVANLAQGARELSYEIQEGFDFGAIIPLLDKIHEYAQEFRDVIEKKSSQKVDDLDGLTTKKRVALKQRVSQIDDYIDELFKCFFDPSVKLREVIPDKLSESLSDNFTVPSIKNLINAKSDKAQISIGTNGSVILGDKVELGDETISNITALNEHPPIYLESPIYWKLSDALEDSKKQLDETAKKRGLSKNQLVSQVPKYFFDVMELLKVQVKTNVFSDIIHTIEEAIKGNLSISDGGIRFVDKASNTSVGLNLTALGVTNLGMIALLLKRGAILPGTFLFIDEPEVHLHPSWQVVFVQVLYELSKRGVNVVIASHSIDIMKAIENIMDSDDEVDHQQHFGINQLSAEGNSIDISEHNFKRIAAIKEDLGKPFYEMFMGV